jgi:PIN domain nuclease of toxin-antitoxin system
MAHGKDPSPQLLQEVEERAQDPEAEVFVSQVSVGKMAIKVSLGRLRVAELESGEEHCDPFDRLPVCQSLVEPMLLLSVDRQRRNPFAQSCWAWRGVDCGLDNLAICRSTRGSRAGVHLRLGPRQPTAANQRPSAKRPTSWRNPRRKGRKTPEG